MKSTFKYIFKILKKNYFFQNFIFHFLNIFENNFYMVKKRASSGNKTLYSTCV